MNGPIAVGAAVGLMFAGFGLFLYLFLSGIAKIEATSQKSGGSQ